MRFYDFKRVFKDLRRFSDESIERVLGSVRALYLPSKKTETRRNFDKSLKYILTNSYCFLAYTYGLCPYDLSSSK